MATLMRTQVMARVFRDEDTNETSLSFMVVQAAGDSAAYTSQEGVSRGVEQGWDG